MPIAETALAKWSRHQAGTAFKEAHLPIREALERHTGLSRFKCEVFLQGSYKNDTNLGGDSDVDVVVRLTTKLKPRWPTSQANSYRRTAPTGSYTSNGSRSGTRR